MNVKSYYLESLKFCFILFCLSCSRGNDVNSDVKNEPNYFLEKVDSIRINRENKVRIIDFDSLNNHFMAFDQITQEFLILDNQGKIIDSSFLVGNGPNEYNSSILAASFNIEKGGYFLQSSSEFIWYNENWKVEKRIRYLAHVQRVFYTGPKLKVPYYTLQEDDYYFYTSFLSGFIWPPVGNEITSEYLIELYNTRRDSIEWVLPNNPQSLPEFELGTDEKQIKPVQVFSLNNKDKNMFLTFEKSKEIGVYDLVKDFELIDKIKFEHKDFIKSNNSKNTAIFKFGSEIYAILYFMGLSEVQTEARRSDDANYSSFTDPSLYRIVVIENSMQQENEIIFPLECEPNSEIIQLSKNRIMLRDKYLGSEEPEYSTYSIFELKPR